MSTRHTIWSCECGHSLAEHNATRRYFCNVAGCNCARFRVCVEAITAKPKPSKYRNVKVAVGPLTFDSKQEARRWGELQSLQKIGAIHNLVRQIPYNLRAIPRVGASGDPVLIETYVADFVYFDGKDVVVEDSKGAKTRDYLRKRKWMKLVYGITILETGLTKKKPRRRIKAHG